MTKRRLFALLLVLAMVFTLAACGKKAEDPVDTGSTPPTDTSNDTGSETPDNKPEPDDKVLVVGVDAAFDGKFNPFLAETVYDRYVVDQVFTSICIIDENNELQPYAGDVTYEEQADGKVLYTITIQEGLTYSDGTPITIDDFIYHLYVKSDPSYTGPGQMLGSTIEGVKEYYYGNPNYSADIAAIEAECAKYAMDVITFEDFLVYSRETDIGGEWSNIETAIADIEAYEYGDKLADIDQTNEDEVFELLARAIFDLYLSYFDVQDYFLTKMKSEYALQNIGSATDVTEITGIKKIDDYTCTVLDTTVDIYGARGLTVPNGTGYLIPQHYYGELKKGDVSAILANMTPMGAGPYLFESYESNIVTCVANVDFFLGVPRTGTVRWQVVPTTDVVELLVSGAIDIANPSASKDNVAEIQANPHIRYDLIDNAGYGYMAMNTENVSLNARKAVWSLMNRKPSVEAYYGPELAGLIERPMTTTLAEYPDGATEYYGYSREKALEYFALAGYTQKDGVLVNEAGEKFVINCFIGGQGSGAHPAYSMLVQAAEDLEALGGEIQIQDVNMNVMTAARDDGTADMWIMAWASVYDCDKRTQFHSTGGQNSYKYNNPKMDALLDEIVMTLDLEARRALVSEMLDLAMEDCIEFPLYQRKNMIAYNGDNVDLSTIPQATTAADYTQVLWQVAVN